MQERKRIKIKDGHATFAAGHTPSKEQIKILEKMYDKAYNMIVPPTKLKLEHLIPYLSHELIMFFPKSGRVRKLKGAYNDDKSGELRFQFDVVNQGQTLWSYIPALVPVEDLLDHNLDYWIGLGEIIGTMNPDYFSEALIEKRPYSMSIEKLMEVQSFLDSNHIDWRFDLIKNNLATDKKHLNLKSI